MQEYKTRTEIAEAVGLSRQTIYLYEKQGLIKPAIKTDTVNLYTISTVDEVKRIQDLLKDHKLTYIKDLLDRERANNEK
jgi:DNA-binding transcriptional MerR regulator